MTLTTCLRSLALPHAILAAGRNVGQALLRGLSGAVSAAGGFLGHAVGPLGSAAGTAGQPDPPAVTSGPAGPVVRLAALAVPVLSVVLGVLSSARGWFGPSIEELSDRQNTGVLILPVNGAFSIWGAIYPGLLGLAAAQAFGRGVDNPRYARARLPLIVNMVFNFVWFVVTQREERVASVAVLIGQFLTALWLYHALDIPRVRVEGLERVWRASASLYAGWLTVASVISVAGLLEFVGFSGLGLGAAAWAVVMLLACAATGLLGRLAWRDPVYGAVFVWAFAGVAIKPGQPGGVALTAWLLAGGMLASLLPPVARRLAVDRAREG